MNEMSQVEITVAADTAVALADAHLREAVGWLIGRLDRPGEDDPLIALFEGTAAKARAAGLPRADVEAERASYNTKHRA